MTGDKSLDRRRFLQGTAVATGAALLHRTASAQGANMIDLATTPHPDGWLEYTQRPELEGKQLGVMSSLPFSLAAPIAWRFCAG
ncbi:twin-arginine translocation signal domain-containing protein [Epibacterium ulvae]|uniref:twin-arginine translocation signal domain-containing protein n=1 Tax=Epibacterium ulvae TaxID=1156985 RepID=UPI001BFC9809|nr:twin-arginine translocation signal domain-containing protein [Epibacterium ulvae]MBT8154678.1 twin-arginine translocation signal domain-containing protein [Epibacterium ulvae]